MTTKYHYFTKLLNLLKYEQVTYLIDANPSILTPSFYERIFDNMMHNL